MHGRVRAVSVRLQFRVQFIAMKGRLPGKRQLVAADEFIQLDGGDGTWLGMGTSEPLAWQLAAPHGVPRALQPQTGLRAPSRSQNSRKRVPTEKTTKIP